MNFRKLNQKKLRDMVRALNDHGLPVDNYSIRRIAALMNYHRIKHDIHLTPYQAGNLFKLEIVEALVRKCGREFVHTVVPASLN